LPSNINEVKRNYNESPPQLINVATLPCKMKRSPRRYTTKETKFHAQKTEVVKVNIKVINASLTQNQCLQCVTQTNAAFNACEDIVTARRH